ncbi:MAG: DUF177 domain-containing protein [Desulfobacterota bacterium]|nr:DUF177 domain-containing protein [Thermodesulfobacteriota bacterium]
MTMKPIPPDSVPRGGLKIDRILEPEWLRDRGQERNLGFVPAGPFEIRGELNRVNQELVFAGRLKATVRLACGRCLEDFTIEVSGPLEARWRIVAAPTDRSGRSEEEGPWLEDLETGDLRQGGLDLAEYLLEQVILNIPMAPLCREDCRGICPVCGANRNSGLCQCGGERKESPFKDLKKLIK